MKRSRIKNKFTLIAVLFHLFAYSQIDDLNIKGKWEDKQMKVEYDFMNDKDAYFSQMGYGMPVSYTIDFTKSPFWIDFTLQRAGTKIQIPSLLRIINKDTIWIEQFPPYSNHPTEFSKDFTSFTRKIHVLIRKKS